MKLLINVFLVFQVKDIVFYTKQDDVSPQPTQPYLVLIQLQPIISSLMPFTIYK